MKSVYLDSNVLVTYYAIRDRKEKENRELISNAFDVFASLKVKISVSMWTITEMVKVLIKEKNMSSKEVSRIANDFIKDPKLNNLRIHFIDVHPLKKYKFDDFFNDVREKMIIYNPGWGDAMHTVIMRNNGIKEILTLDGKDDFKIVPGITVIHPKDVTKSIK